VKCKENDCCAFICSCQWEYIRKECDQFAGGHLPLKDVYFFVSYIGSHIAQTQQTRGMRTKLRNVSYKKKAQ